MSTDRELQEAVLDALEFEPTVTAAHIGVTVEDGVVTLTGHVERLREKWSAEMAARGVADVRAVANDIDVSIEGADRCSDSEIARAAASALDRNSAIPPHTVRVTVRDSWVSLTGTVLWQYQKLAAEQAIQRLHGVKGVVNSLTVEPPVVDLSL